MNFPGSPSDKNAPYRAAIQALASGYGYVPNDHTDNDGTASPSSASPHAHHPDDRLTELAQTRSRRVASSSSSRTANLADIVEALRRSGIHYKRTVFEDTLLSRLETLEISINTLLSAINIARSAHHTAMQSLNANPDETLAVIGELASIINYAGAKPHTVTAAKNAENDPARFVANILESIRAKRS